MNALLSLVLMAVQPGITPPTAGFVRDAAGAVRPVYGLAGSFVPGPPVVLRAAAAAFSETLRWIQTENRLLLLDEQGNPLYNRAAPARPAVFAFGADGTSALALVPETGEVVVWSPAGPRPESVGFEERRRPPPRELPRGVRVARLDPLQLAGEVVAAGLDGAERIRLVARRDDALWSLEVPLATGRVEREAVLDGVSAPLLILPDGRLVYAAGSEIAVRDAGGVQSRLTAEAPVAALELMGGDWVHVVVEAAGRASFALDVRPGRQALYRLPEARP